MPMIVLLSSNTYHLIHRECKSTYTVAAAEDAERVCLAAAVGNGDCQGLTAVSDDVILDNTIRAPTMIRLINKQLPCLFNVD
jgi:hypothetical protein